MKKYDIPTYEDFYNQVIVQNKTNKMLCDYYKVSQIVIRRWKNIYKIRKDIELIKKSYVVWNKGLKGHLNSENCKKTWFKSEDLAKRAEKSIGVPKDDKRKWLICLTNDKKDVVNSRNGKTYKHRKREGYARWILKQEGIEIPKGYVVYHKDGNYTNNEIGNLDIISRAELLKRNQK